MQPATAWTTSGSHGEVTINLVDYPSLVCGQCGSKAFVQAEFPAEVLLPVTDSVPRATAKGFRAKEWSCRECHRPPAFDAVGPLLRW